MCLTVSKFTGNLALNYCQKIISSFCCFNGEERKSEEEGEKV